MEKIKKVIIPVAGLGTRLLPATKSQPKEMLPVGRKPTVQYVVEEMVKADLKHILFVTGRNKQSIENHFDRDEELINALSRSSNSELIEELRFEEMETKFYYTRQSKPLGLADAILRGEDFVGNERFVVGLGDSIIISPNLKGFLGKMINSHIAHKSACTIAVEEVPIQETHRYGVVSPKDKISDDFEIADLVEKPSPENAPSNLTIAARYVFEPVIFEAIGRTIPDKNGELQITDSIRVLIKQGYQVRCVKLSSAEKRYDIGNFESYFKAFIDFAVSDEKYGYLIRQYLRKIDI